MYPEDFEQTPEQLAETHAIERKAAFVIFGGLCFFVGYLAASAFHYFK